MDKEFERFHQIKLMPNRYILDKGTKMVLLLAWNMDRISSTFYQHTARCTLPNGINKGN
ncbi:hypothetical protein GLOIN_2v1511697, partial [Rhizophagus irregularis DAOM 181602=DAOM 197198]